jgi:hypothetical protein
MTENIVTGDDGAGRKKSMKIDYPANSQKSKQTRTHSKEKHIEKITSGEVIQRKPSRLKDAFSGDDTNSVISYILFDVVIPAAKSMLADATSEFIERMLFGEGRRNSGGRKGYTSYNKVYNGPRNSNNPNKTGRPEMSRRARASHDFNEVILSSRGEAEHVLDSLIALIEDYGVATVSDLYDLVGITGNFTDDKWGWYELRGSNITRVREGFLINLPQTQPIE